MSPANGAVIGLAVGLLWLLLMAMATPQAFVFPTRFAGVFTISFFLLITTLFGWLSGGLLAALGGLL